ncbi:MAG: hypothetical protein GF400_08060 [Candidatus Eisenbacteria bacterium]|nr:hypothetical protein [Candidatus Eisenbacteria bacterium]
MLSIIQGTMVSREFPATVATSGVSALSGDSRRARTVWLLVGLVALGASLRFYRLDAQSLWIDEVYTMGAAAVGGRLSFRAFFGNIQGPLYALLVHLVSTLSASTFALRSVSALLGTALIPATFLLGKTLVDRSTGLVAALFVCVSPFAVWYSQELRNYSLLMFLAALSTIAAWNAVASRKGRWGPYVLPAALSIYSNLSALFLIASHALFAAPRSLRDRVFMQRALLAFALVALLAAPLAWGVTMWAEQARVQEKATFAPEAEAAELRRGDLTYSPLAAPYAVFSMAYGYSLGPGLVELHQEEPMEEVMDEIGIVLPAGIILAAVGLLGLKRLAELRGRLGFALLVALVPLVGASILALFNVKPFNPRYVSVAFPVLMVTLAAGVVPLRRPAAILLSGAFVLFCLLSLHGHYHEPRYRKSDIRAASAYVEENDRAGDVVLVPVVRDVFNHYYGGSAPRFVFHAGQAGSLKAVEERIERNVEGAERLWYVRARPWEVDRGGRIARYLDENHRLLERIDFTGVSVRLYGLSASGGGAAEDGAGVTGQSARLSGSVGGDGRWPGPSGGVGPVLHCLVAAPGREAAFIHSAQVRGSVALWHRLCFAERWSASRTAVGGEVQRG